MDLVNWEGESNTQKEAIVHKLGGFNEIPNNTIYLHNLYNMYKNVQRGYALKDKFQKKIRKELFF